MKVILATGSKDFGKKTAELIIEQVKSNPNSVLGLATGSSPIETYKSIIEDFKENNTDYSNIKTVNLDEYCGIDTSNEQSYKYFMDDNLFNHINIKKDNTFIPNGKALDMSVECDRYEELIKSLGGVDLQLLGIGSNGHIGFNEPNTHFTKKTNCVDLEMETIEANSRFFSSIDEVPKQALSMGIGTIMSAKKILLIATGHSKSNMIYETIFGEVSPKSPCTILQFHPDVTIIADEDAMSKVLINNLDVVN